VTHLRPQKALDEERHDGELLVRIGHVSVAPVLWSTSVRCKCVNGNAPGASDLRMAADVSRQPIAKD
jgi:hypothetical protein